MDTYNEEKLVKYVVNGQQIKVGFATIEDAETYAAQHLGDLVEVAFIGGNDNPQLTAEVGLIKRRLHFFVDAGPEYKFVHSADPEFRKLAEELQQRKSQLNKESFEEKYFSNGEIEIAEDPIIVLKNNEFESITSRERCKYLKNAKVYEVGVREPSKE